MTQKELAENVAKCYDSLPDKGDDAIETLITTTAYFISVNVNKEENSIDEAIRRFRDALVYKLKSNES